MITFLTIARVLFDKGFRELIECAKYYKVRKTNIRFQWLGEIDSGYSDFISLEDITDLHNEGIIEYLGVTSNVKKYITNADCIILPSYHEGMSRVLMESLAMGKPIITTNIPGCKETVIEKVNGLLCEPKNSKSLIQTVDEFMNIPLAKRLEMGKQSRKLAEERFDIKSVIKEYEKIVSEIINTNK